MKFYALEAGAVVKKVLCCSCYAKEEAQEAFDDKIN
jgi:hypothetical protein